MGKRSLPSFKVFTSSLSFSLTLPLYHSTTLPLYHSTTPYTFCVPPFVFLFPIIALHCPFSLLPSFHSLQNSSLNSFKYSSPVSFIVFFSFSISLILSSHSSLFSF